MREFFTPDRLIFMIPIISIVAVAVIILAIVALGYARRRRLFELYHEERMAAIAKGVEVPPLSDGLLDGGRTPRSTLLKGLIWTFVGVPLFFALRAEDPKAALFALIPVGIGMAYLIYYWVEGRKAAPPAEPPPSTPTMSALADAKS